MLSTDERQSAERGSSVNLRGSSGNERGSPSAQGLADEKNLAETEAPVAGCLKGEECIGTPQSIHRLFEEMLETNNSPETAALIYGGELRNYFRNKNANPFDPHA